MTTGGIGMLECWGKEYMPHAAVSSRGQDLLHNVSSWTVAGRRGEHPAGVRELMAGEGPWWVNCGEAESPWSFPPLTAEQGVL